jgi:hypothetical protein
MNGLQIGLAALLIFGVAQIALTYSISAGHRPRLRSIPVFNALRSQLSRAIEAGRSLHVSVGTGSLSGEDTATTLAGMAIVEYLADEAAASGIAPVITTADPTTLILVEDTLRRPHVRQGDLSGYSALSAQLLALNPTQYAVAAMDYLAHHPVAANVMSGVFGPEVALIDHEADKQSLPQLLGATDPRALAVMTATSDNVLIGEEVFAAKAYLQARPTHLASLRAQDILRWVIVAGTMVWFIVNLSSPVAH